MKKDAEQILADLVSDDAEVRAEYLRVFEAEVCEFSLAIAPALEKWRSLDTEINGSCEKAYISAMVFSAITFHIASMKLFLSGHTVAAGNLSRTVAEFIALALVCSGKNLGILERFTAGKYSANDAVRDVLRHARTLGLTEDGVNALKDTREFYHNYSHPSVLTMATLMSFSERGGVYMGAAFDNAKIDAYRKEASIRVSLAKVSSSFVEAIVANLAKW